MTTPASIIRDLATDLAMAVVPGGPLARAQAAIESYAVTVAAAEREACALGVETLEMRPPLSRSERVVRDGYARAIRLRAPADETGASDAGPRNLGG